MNWSENYCRRVRPDSRGIERYTTRSGTVLTGRYSVLAGEDDGLNPEATTAGRVAISLTRDHAANPG
jgi:hypothetical protein